MSATNTAGVAALDAIAAIVGRQHVLHDEAAMARYLIDERRLYEGRALAVVRPGTRGEVAELMRTCHEARLAVVPQGGNTGYCGGATPDRSGAQLVVSLERLNNVIEVDGDSACMTLEAGVALAAARQAADSAGLLLPLAMGSQASCQIGGNLSTNAGGLAVLRYGNTRDLTLGLEVVLADGRVLSDLGGLRKNNTGYDLKQLFIGAEGTLGIITAACLRLFPRPRAYGTVFIALRDLADAVHVLALLREGMGDNVTSCEYLSADAAAATIAKFPDLHLPTATAAAHFLLVEWAEFEAAGVAATDSLAAALADGSALDVVLAHNETQRRQMWRLRENIPAAEKLQGGSLKHDIAVRLGAVAEYVADTRAALAARWPEARLSVYGHVGDGNVHFNVLAPEGVDRDRYFADHGAAISALVHDRARAMDGSFSAEHGIGAYKRDLLAHYAAGPRIELMRAVKQVFDPHGLMNPGKVV